MKLFTGVFESVYLDVWIWGFFLEEKNLQLFKMCPTQCIFKKNTYGNESETRKHLYRMTVLLTLISEMPFSL